MGPKEVFIVALIAGVILSTISSVPLDCTFRNIEFIDSETLYSCEVTNKALFPGPEVVFDGEVRGTHIFGKDIRDVQGFDFKKNVNVKSVPENYERHFPNLLLLSMLTLGISEIHKSHLEPFRFLKYVYLSSNYIEVIEEDLFEYNQYLEVVWLQNNEIVHIEPFVFSSLKFLRVLRLEKNKCRKTLAFASNRTDAITLVEEVENFACFRSDMLFIAWRKKTAREVETLVREQKADVKELELIQATVANVKTIEERLTLAIPAVILIVAIAVILLVTAVCVAVKTKRKQCTKAPIYPHEHAGRC